MTTERVCPAMGCAGSTEKLSTETVKGEATSVRTTRVDEVLRAGLRRTGRRARSVTPATASTVFPSGRNSTRWGSSGSPGIDSATAVSRRSPCAIKGRIKSSSPFFTKTPFSLSLGLFPKPQKSVPDFAHAYPADSMNISTSNTLVVAINIHVLPTNTLLSNAIGYEFDTLFYD